MAASDGFGTGAKLATSCRSSTSAVCDLSPVLVRTLHVNAPLSEPHLTLQSQMGVLPDLSHLATQTAQWNDDLLAPGAAGR